MLITTKDLQRMLATIFFAAGYHVLYADYLHPIFGYMQYRLENREWFQWFFIYSIAVLPSLWQRGSNNAVACGISLIYLLLYVPALITMCAMWIKPFSELFYLALILMIGQFIIQLTGPKHEKIDVPQINQKFFITSKIQFVLAVFTLISLIVFIAENYPHMRLVSFVDVYDLRFASRDSSSALSGYLSMWLVGVSIPFYLSLNIQQKNWLPLIVSIIISVVIYMGNGAKSALLMPIQAYIVGWLVAKGRSPTQFLAIFMGVITWIIYVLDVDWLNILKSLVIMRLLSTGGWTMTTYYEYFSDNGWTYYSHVGPLGAIFGKIYQMELGRIIGLEYLYSEDANFNANFWATDGIAALGALGILIVSFLMAIIFRVIYRLSWKLDQRVTAILLAGLWLSILNGSLFTSMLSGGGFLLLVLLYSIQYKRYCKMQFKLSND